MLAKARVNAAKIGAQNTSFVASRITRVELPDGVADVVVSNCVINLVPGGEKGGVFREMFRLLRPGGRVAVGDILAKREMGVLLGRVGRKSLRGGWGRRGSNRFEWWRRRWILMCIRGLMTKRG